MPETNAKPSKSKFKGGKQATQKNRAKDAPKAQTPAVKTYTPAFLYVSACCSAFGKKEPLVWSPEDKEKGKFSENHKGHFRCTKCGQPSTFSRTKNVDGVQIEQ